MKSIADLASYSIRQDAALQVCESKRSAVVSILDAVSAPVKKAWWKF